jgi:O-antigen/teichoic acid export membrane protein
MATPEERTPTGHFGVLGRVSWGLADQALSSATNFALAVAVARTVSPEEFGAFSLVFVAFLFGLNIARPLATEPLAVRFSGPADQRWRRGATAATGVAFDVGLAGMVICLVVAAFVQGDLGAAFAALAITFPGLLLQDAWRFTFFTCRRGRAAFVNDLAFAVILFPTLVFLSADAAPSIATFILVWGVAASIGAALGIAQSRLVPSPHHLRAWLAEQGDLAPPLVASRIAWVGSGQLSAFTVAAVAGLATVGILRAGELMMGPVNVVTQGINLMAVPEGARLLARSVASLIRGCRWLAIGLALTTLAWGAIVAAMPDTVGEEFLGELWAPARAILPPMVVAVTGYSVMAGGLVGLMVLAEGDRYMRVGLAVSAMVLVATTIGAAIDGAYPAAVGSAIAVWAGAIVVWWQFGRAARLRPT